MWGGLLGGLASGLFGYKGTKDQNIASAAQAQKQMDFQERMSNTAHQRQMADMRKAGINPILSAKYGGASSPSGQQAPVYNKAAVALQNASTAANVQNIMANTAFTNAKSAAIEPWSRAMDVLGDFVPNTKDKLFDSKRKFQEKYGINVSETKKRFQQKTGINVSQGQFGNLNSLLDILKKNPWWD